MATKRKASRKPTAKKPAAKKKAAPKKAKAPRAKKTLETPEIIRVSEGDVRFSELNVNREDSSTFAALKESIADHGLMDMPVVQRESGGGFKCVSGEHRLKALFEDYAEVPVVVAKRQYRDEDEFNVVANMNLIRGRVTMSNIRRVVVEKGLDVRKIDLHGVPSWMIQQESPDAFKVAEKRKIDELQVKRLALQIAKGLAVQIIEERDENGLLVCEAEGKVVVLIGFRGLTTWLRDHREEVKDTVLGALEELDGFVARTVLEAND